MDLNLEFLSIQNPWWTINGQAKKSSIGFKFDPVIEQYENQTLKWRPTVLDKINLNQDNIYCLYGPKGVGKTTLLKLVIKKLIEQNKVDPNRIFFYSCHNLSSYEQLNEMIKLFLNSQAEKKERRYIFIDEIAMVKNWRKGMDHLFKAAKLTETTVILSASSLIEANNKSGNGFKNIAISSLAFGEFANLINPGFFGKITQKNYAVDIKKIEYYLDIYFLTGGFISPINDYKENGAVKQSIYSNYLNWFLVYIAKSGRDIILTRQIIEKLILNLGQPIGYKTLIHKTKAKTHLTAAEYLNILELMFAVKTVYQSEGGQLLSRKAKKVYFQDPFIFWLLYSYIHGSLNYWQLARERLHKPAVFSHLVENTVFSHLIKDEKIEINYWRDNIKKREINFLAKRDKKTTPILIRYDKEISSADFAIFKSAGFKNGIIIGQDKLENKNGIMLMPLTYFLLFYKELIL